MHNSLTEELNELDRDVLMANMASELPLFCGEIGETIDGIALRTGLGKERISLIVSGKRKMKWSEYMSILFVLWENEKAWEMVGERGYFPESLKKAMSINRYTHESENDV